MPSEAPSSFARASFWSLLDVIMERAPHLRVVQALDHHQVAVVERIRFHPQEHLAVAGLWLGPVHHGQAVQSERLEFIRFHVSTLRLPVAATRASRCHYMAADSPGK